MLTCVCMLMFVVIYHENETGKSRVAEVVSCTKLYPVLTKHVAPYQPFKKEKICHYKIKITRLKLIKFLPENQKVEEFAKSEQDAWRKLGHCTLAQRMQVRCSSALGTQVLPPSACCTFISSMQRAKPTGTQLLTESYIRKENFIRLPSEAKSVCGSQASKVVRYMFYSFPNCKCKIEKLHLR